LRQQFSGGLRAASFFIAILELLYPTPGGAGIYACGKSIRISGFSHCGKKILWDTSTQKLLREVCG
jgi:hypothetical protein